jgi:periplasmic copper chaperone A
MRHPAALAAVCLALLVCAATGAQPPALSAQQAWIRAIPGADVASAYLTLHNAAAQPVVVSGVRCDCAREAMIHESRIVNGQSTMRAREQLTIAPGQTLQLAPGGLHIMLMGLSRALKAGDSVALVLTLGDGTTLDVSARVRALGEQ